MSTSSPTETATAPAASTHLFWSKQPVVPSSSTLVASPTHPSPIPEGEVDPSYDVPIPQPLPLPAGFTWSPFSVLSPSDLSDLYTLLSLNYVEDASSLSRFDYSAPFLRWALSSPGYSADYHCAIRVTGTGKLVAFIAGTARTVRVRRRVMRSLEINFLCVIKKLRDKRLAPVLIKEITRRIAQEGLIRCAMYTGGSLIHAPLASTTYWHRPLDTRKLLDVGFVPQPAPVGRHANAAGAAAAQQRAVQRLTKLHALPTTTALPFRAMQESDVSAVHALLSAHLDTLQLVPVYDEDDIRHWFLPRADIVHTYVLPSPAGSSELAGFASFYVVDRKFFLPGRAQPVVVKTAQALYHVRREGGDAPGLEALLNDALVLAATEAHCDVYSTLDVMGVDAAFKACKFMPSNGTLHYYMYNFHTDPIDAKDVGIILV